MLVVSHLWSCSQIIPNCWWGVFLWGRCPSPLCESFFHSSAKSPHRADLQCTEPSASVGLNHWMNASEPPWISCRPHTWFSQSPVCLGTACECDDSCAHCGDSATGRDTNVILHSNVSQQHLASGLHSPLQSRQRQNDCQFMISISHSISFGVLFLLCFYRLYGSLISQGGLKLRLCVCACPQVFRCPATDPWPSVTLSRELPFHSQQAGDSKANSRGCKQVS